MKLSNLDDEGVRTLMLDEIDSDIAQNKLYMSKVLKPGYKNVYIDLLKEAVSNGDSDSLALVSYLRRRGKKVYIFSSQNNISEELRTGGDGYFDILKIKEDVWGKELRHRKEIRQ